MPKLKLTYFDFHGGRGEPIRLAMSVGGLDFEDERLKLTQWSEVKPSTPFGALPVLTVDDTTVLAQSNTILRYVGKLTGLYPEDALDAARCDEILDAVEEADTKVGATMRLDDEAKRVARLALADGPLQTFGKALGDRLTAAGGEWFAGGKPSVADIKVFVTMRQLRSGRLDHIPTDLFDKISPVLLAHSERVAALPGVRAWYTKQGVA